MHTLVWQRELCTSPYGRQILFITLRKYVVMLGFSLYIYTLVDIRYTQFLSNELNITDQAKVLIKF